MADDELLNRQEWQKEKSEELANGKVILTPGNCEALFGLHMDGDTECVIIDGRLCTPFGALVLLEGNEAVAVYQFSDGSKLILEEAKGKSLTDSPGELIDALLNVVTSLCKSGKGTKETAILAVKLEEAKRWLTTKTF